MSEDDFESMIGPIKKWESPNFVSLRQKIRSQRGLVETSDKDEDQERLVPVDFFSTEIHHQVAPEDILSFKRDGIQLSVFKKLRLGQYSIQRSIDLHRMRAHQAAAAVAQLLSAAYSEGLRTLLITHGKGAHSDPPAVLKSLVNQWLRSIPHVLAFHSATSKHGGSGSVYVMIKKNKQCKASNRSVHGQ